MTFFATNAGGSNFDTNVVTIPISTSTSTSIDLSSNGFVGFITPAALTGTAFTFTGSIDDSTFTAIYNSSNTAYSITVGTSRYYMLNPADFLGCRYVRIVSNGTEAAARTITVITRSFV